MSKGIYKIFIKLSKILSRKGIYEFLDKEYAAIKKGDRVLSVGAGGDINFLLMKYAKSNEFEVITIDINKDRNPDIIGDVCVYDFGDMVFDIVVMGEVLEHLHSPHAAIENIYRSMKTDGRLIMTAPFIFPIHERPCDYFRYTRYGLEYLLGSFEEVNINERNGWGEAVNVLFVRHVMEKNILSRLIAPLFILLAFICLPFTVLLSKLIRTDFITSGYLVSAKKPSGRAPAQISKNA